MLKPTVHFHVRCLCWTLSRSWSGTQLSLPSAPCLSPSMTMDPYSTSSEKALLSQNYRPSLILTRDSEEVLAELTPEEKAALEVQEKAR